MGDYPTLALIFWKDVTSVLVGLIIQYNVRFISLGKCEKFFIFG